MSDIAKLIQDFSEHAPGGTGLFSRAAVLIYRKRLEQAGNILRRRMAKGKPWLFAEDKVAALTFDFLKAAADGTARQNLDVMAELIANGVAEEGLTEEAIRDMIRIVRDLAYDEMRALAALLRAQATYQPPADLSEPPTKFWIACQIYELAWRELAGPAHEEPPEEVVGTFGALLRTGLIYTDSAWEGMKFAGTPKLVRLAGLIDAAAFPTKPWG